jgi:hypothetical protein
MWCKPFSVTLMVRKTRTSWSVTVRVHLTKRKQNDGRGYRLAHHSGNITAEAVSIKVRSLALLGHPLLRLRRFVFSFDRC